MPGRCFFCNSAQLLFVLCVLVELRLASIINGAAPSSPRRGLLSNPAERWPSLECIKDRIASQNISPLGRPSQSVVCLLLLPTCHAAAKNLRHPANPCSNRAPYR